MDSNSRYFYREAIIGLAREILLAYTKQVDEYKKQAVNGATPLQLVIMLYDGAIRFMELGRDAVEKKNYDLQNKYLQRAQNIISELMSSLDLDKGGEMAQNLMGLYQYVLQQLIDANVNDETEPIDRSIRVLANLLDSWRTIEKRGRTGPANPVIAA